MIYWVQMLKSVKIRVTLAVPIVKAAGDRKNWRSGSLQTIPNLQIRYGSFQPLPKWLMFVVFIDGILDLIYWGLS